jgi:hypothetical protein
MSETFEPKPRPGIAGYIIGAVFIIVGIICAAAFIGKGIVSSLNSGERFVVPGHHTFTVDAPGKYMIYHEFVSNFDGRIFNTKGQIDGLRCNASGPENAPRIVRVDPAGITATYDIMGNSGEAIWSIDVPTPGTYSLDVGYGEPGALTTLETTGTNAVLSIGRGPGKLVRSVLTALLILFVCVTGGGILIMVTLMRHFAAKRLQLHAAS